MSDEKSYRKTPSAEEVRRRLAELFPLAARDVREQAVLGILDGSIKIVKVREINRPEITQLVLTKDIWP